MKTESEIRKRFEEVSRDLESSKKDIKTPDHILYVLVGIIETFRYVLDEISHDRK